jgi:hypothetical protein
VASFSEEDSKTFVRSSKDLKDHEDDVYRLENRVARVNESYAF